MNRYLIGDADAESTVTGMFGLTLAQLAIDRLINEQFHEYSGAHPSAVCGLPADSA